MSCSVCQRDEKVIAKGLCSACYSRMQKRGTTDYAPVRVRGVCSVSDCESPHAALGFCDLHYNRFKKLGDPLVTARPDDWGAKHKHPLFNRWAYAMRRKNEVSAEWHDFLTFALDIGTPPSAKSKIFRADDSKPLGRDNFVWKEAITQRAEGECEKTYKARLGRVYRQLDPDRYAGYDLKKHYGLSAKEYRAMLNACDHKCQICEQPEGAVIRGKKIRLAIDHCHGTGNIRGLLCSSCNRALGGFKDNAEILKRAIAYLAGANDP